MRHLLLGLLSSSILLACESSLAAPPSPTPPVAAPVVLALEPTDALIVRAHLRALVDALAQHDTIESSHIGAAGAPSKAWAAWEPVRKAATRDELIALLRHQSPVVRGYVAAELLTTTAQLDDAAWRWVEPVLRDKTQVRSISGCELGTDTLGVLAYYDLMFNAPDKVGARKMVGVVATDPGFAAYDIAKRSVR